MTRSRLPPAASASWTPLLGHVDLGLERRQPGALAGEVGPVHRLVGLADRQQAGRRLDVPARLVEVGGLGDVPLGALDRPLGLGDGRRRLGLGGRYGRAGGPTTRRQGGGGQGEDEDGPGVSNGSQDRGG